MVERIAERESMNEKATLFNENGYVNGFKDGYAKAITDLQKRFRNEYEDAEAMEMEDCSNWADWLDATAEQIMTDRKKGE